MQNMDHHFSDHHDDYPVRHFTWNIISSPGVVSRMHIDTGGLATASWVLEGEKYWVVGEPLPEYRDLLQRRSIMAFTSFRDNYVDPGYRYEAMSLRKNDVL